MGGGGGAEPQDAVSKGSQPQPVERPVRPGVCASAVDLDSVLFRQECGQMLAGSSALLVRQVCPLPSRSQADVPLLSST